MNVVVSEVYAKVKEKILQDEINAFRDMI